MSAVLQSIVYSAGSAAGCALRPAVRAELIGHFQPCMTEIYLHIDARMADYIRTHPATRGASSSLSRATNASQVFSHNVGVRLAYPGALLLPLKLLLLLPSGGTRPTAVSSAV